MNGTFFGREPVAIAAFVAIAINLGVSFGLKLSVDQIALVNALVVAGLALLVRSNVTAPANLPGSTATPPKP
jgi:hypothetical protein